MDERSSFTPTPFDLLILELRQSTSRNPKTEIGSLVFNQLRFLRVIYIDYAMIKVESFGDYNYGASDARQFSGDEILRVQDSGIRVMIRYLSFLDALNQFGRCLNGLTNGKENLPLYAEIRFFRNKIAEHWDDGYFSLKPGGSYTSSAKKLPVPALNGEPCFTKDVPILVSQLRDMFVKSNVPLISLDNLHDDIYSQKIYTLLKQIDPKLRSQSRHCGTSCKKDLRTGIPDDLVKLLLKFAFPLPIYDIETYCSQLVVYLRTLKLKTE